MPNSSSLLIGKLNSIGDRLLAQVVGGLVIFGAFYLVDTATVLRLGGITSKGFELKGSSALLAIGGGLAIGLAYLILAEALLGGTLGKLAAGIRVQTKEGQPINMGASLISNLLRIMDALGVYLVAAAGVCFRRRSLVVDHGESFISGSAVVETFDGNRPE